MKDENLNRDLLIFHFSEIHQDVANFMQKIRDGEIDDIGDHALSQRFDHILSHLCAAWHCRHLSPPDFDAVMARKDMFVWMMNSVPNWNNDHKLVEMDATFPSEE